MSTELGMQLEYQMGPEKKYFTEYTWTLNDWWLMYESVYQKGVSSTSFELNGTDGYTCTCYFSPTNPNQGLQIHFSDTLDIEAMKLTYHITNTWDQANYYCRPILKSYTYNLKQASSKDISDYVPKNSKNDALVIVIKIIIVKVSDTIGSPNQTAMPLKTSQKSNSPLPDILTNFRIMFNRKAFCDVTFVLGEKTFPAHKAVLAAQSKVFEAMFSSGMKEQKDNKIEIIDTEAEVFEQFLNYLYGDKVTESGKIIEQMIVIADFYDVSCLKSMCENIMIKTLTGDSVVRYVILADKLKCSALKNAALRFIRNSNTVFEKALVEGDLETITCLKEILSNNQPEKETVACAVNLPSTESIFLPPRRGVATSRPEGKKMRGGFSLA